MISTVTTSTVSTVTVAGSIAIVGIFVLMALLIQKELTSASSDERANALSKLLNVGIVPLLIAFVLIVLFKIADVLK